MSTSPIASASVQCFQALTDETSTVNVSNETEIEMPNASTLLIHSMVGSSIEVAQGTDLQLRLGEVKIFDKAPCGDCRQLQIAS